MQLSKTSIKKILQNTFSVLAFLILFGVSSPVLAYDACDFDVPVVPCSVSGIGDFDSWAGVPFATSTTGDGVFYTDGQAQITNSENTVYIVPDTACVYGFFNTFQCLGGRTVIKNEGFIWTHDPTNPLQPFCETYEFSEWSACTSEDNATQTRTVISTSPENCFQILPYWETERDCYGSPLLFEIFSVEPYNVSTAGGEEFTMLGYKFYPDTTISMCGVSNIELISLTDTEIHWISPACPDMNNVITIETNGLAQDWTIKNPEGDFNIPLIGDVPTIPSPLDNPTGFVSESLSLFFDKFTGFLRIVFVPDDGYFSKTWYELNRPVQRQVDPLYDNAPLVNTTVHIGSVDAPFVFDPFHSIEIPEFVRTFMTWITIIGAIFWLIRKMPSLFGQS
jgi:hypothetical protein